MRFYMEYGPEPIIPRVTDEVHDTSLRRSVRSFLVYSSMILVVMCLVEPKNGILKQFANHFYHWEFPVEVDAPALCIMLLIAVSVTVGGSAISFYMSRFIEVSPTSSISVSRSNIERSTLRGENARIISFDHSPQRHTDDVINNSSEVLDTLPPIVGISVEDSTTERVISRAECLSILIYDALSFSAGSCWAYFIMGAFAVLTSDNILTEHPYLYIQSAFLYFIFFLVIVGRLVRLYFPTEEEIIEDQSIINVIEGGGEDWSRMGRGLLINPSNIEMAETLPREDV